MGPVDEPAVRTCCLLCPGWPHDDARGFEVVARAVEALTPRLVVERPGVLFFPARGPSRYFGGDAALARRVVASAAGAGTGGARAGIADGMLAARLAARSVRSERGPEGDQVVVERGGSAAFLAGWPVRVLARVEGVGADLIGLLGRLGLHTLGQVAALDAGSVAERFGAEGARLHLLCRGLDVEPMGLRTPPAEIVEQICFEPPVEHAEAVVFAAKGLAERLFDRLRARALTCVRAALEIETEEGSSITASWRWEQELTPVALAELVRRRLDPGAGDAQPAGPIAALRLVPEEVVPLTGMQAGLWGGSYADLARVERLVASLQGMLGFGSVVTGQVGGGRTPLERTRWIPWGEPLGAREGAPARRQMPREQPGWPGAIPAPAPARVFDPPLPAELLDAAGRVLAVSSRGDVTGEPAALRCNALPGRGGPIVAWEGPWFHDLRWWQPGSRRRRALWRVVVSCVPDAPGVPGVPGGVACLVSVERGRAGVEAIHD